MLTYGMMYGVTRTTLYLPESLRAALKRRARVEGRTEADIVREALEAALAAYRTPEPQIPLFASTELVSDRVDELLAGFGER
jgi:plasmid stability protein